MTTISSCVYPFSVAPMLRWTTPHCRYFYRLLSLKTLLYTEMVTSQAFLIGKVEQSPRESWEHPITLQLAGSDPVQLQKAAQIAEDLGFDAINLNIGCPSPCLKALNAGAHAFLDPQQVGLCVKAMKKKCQLPISIKTRIGVNEHDQPIDLWKFLKITHEISGCSDYILHARKAWLSGLNPYQNRTVPALNYEMVYNAKKQFPHLSFILNGGLNFQSALDKYASQPIDGVMLGRSVWRDPKILLFVDKKFFNSKTRPSAQPLFDGLTEYLIKHKESSHWRKAWHPLMNLFSNTPWSKKWKQDCHSISSNPKDCTHLLNIYSKFFETLEEKYV